MLRIKRVPTIVSNYQKEEGEEGARRGGGCGRNCLNSCCIPGFCSNSFLILYMNLVLVMCFCFYFLLYALLSIYLSSNWDLLAAKLEKLLCPLFYLPFHLISSLLCDLSELKLLRYLKIKKKLFFVFLLLFVV